MGSSVAFRQLRDVIATQELLVEQLRRQIILPVLVKRAGKAVRGDRAADWRQKKKIAILGENSVSRAEYEAIVKKLEKEEEEHAKTKSCLAKESEQLEFALGEIDVLSKQLEREKQAFDNALSNVKNRVLKESVQKDKLKSRCTEIESHIQKQEDILNSKDNEIKELQHFVNKQKQTLKKQASDFKIQKQQEYYIAKVLGEKTRKNVK